MFVDAKAYVQHDPYVPQLIRHLTCFEPIRVDRAVSLL